MKNFLAQNVETKTLYGYVALALMSVSLVTFLFAYVLEGMELEGTYQLFVGALREPAEHSAYEVTSTWVGIIAYLSSIFSFLLLLILLETQKLL